MRKKQLALQNTSLFAEIERKAGEIESLNLRIEELMEKLENQSAEIQDLELDIEDKEIQISQLKKDNAILSNELEKSNAEVQSLALLVAKGGLSAKETNSAPAPTPAAAPIFQAEPSPEPSFKVEPVVEPVAPPTKSRSFTPINDIMRDYGAQTIGKVTRIAALAVAKAMQNGGDNQSSIQTLALGKNESFKFQVLSLLESGREHAEIKSEIDRLANETITYLESL